MRRRPASGACAPAFVSLAVLLLAVSAAQGAGVTFLPGATRDAVVPSPPSHDLLTWELPDGLLVADRLGPAGAVRLGSALPRTWSDAEWFVVRGRAGAAHAGAASAREVREALARHGTVHEAGVTAFVIEVPRARLDGFFAAGFRSQRIDLAPPPVTAAPAAARKSAGPAPLAAATVDTALKRAFVNQLSGPAFNQLIQEISGYATFYYQGTLRQVRTRHYNQAAKNLAAEYMASKLAGYGYAVEFDTFLVNSVACRNVVATKPGRTWPDEHVVVGGHYDSMPSGTTAPGAEDNASGTSLVMEIARVAANRQFDRTVQFVLFDSEEQGLYGSEHFVAEAVAAGRTITNAIVADMVAWHDQVFGLHIEGETDWEALMQAMAANVGKYTPCSYVKDYYSWGSDHVPFQQAGIPAFLAIDYDYESYPYYHQTGDTWLRIQQTAALGLQITRAAAATLADAAGLWPDLTSVPPQVPPPSLLAAWPNPFNPRVTVAFHLDAPARGEVAMYDLAGRRVRTLAGGELPAGETRLVWDGRDHRGREMPSGTYLCRLRAGGRTATLKLNLAR